jgi:serine/threonine protein kinase
MQCPFCRAENGDGADVCFKCGRGLFALTQGSVVASRYEILATLGQGGMGTVYKAHDRELDEIVALKVLRGDFAAHPEIAKRFRSEIKLARRIRHRNVCGIHEYGQEGHLRYISMEFIDGVDFRRVLRAHGALRPPEAFDVSIQVAEGLQAIHDEGIVHRDLKTPNIMRDSRGVVRLMDFGIAKEWETQSGTSLTALGQIVGTPEYMSPEQVRGERVDSRSDIYALGIVTFELFAGEVPFRGDTPVVILLRQINDPVPLEGPVASKLPKALIPVLGKAMAKAAAERYATAREMAEALRDAERASAPWPTTESSVQSIHTNRMATAPAVQAEVVASTPVPTDVPTQVPTLPLPTAAKAAQQLRPPEPAARGDDQANFSPAAHRLPPPRPAACNAPTPRQLVPMAVEKRVPLTRLVTPPPPPGEVAASHPAYRRPAVLAAAAFLVASVAAVLIHQATTQQVATDTRPPITPTTTRPVPGPTEGLSAATGPLALARPSVSPSPVISATSTTPGTAPQRSTRPEPSAAVPSHPNTAAMKSDRRPPTSMPTAASSSSTAVASPSLPETRPTGERLVPAAATPPASGPDAPPHDAAHRSSAPVASVRITESIASASPSTPQTQALEPPGTLVLKVKPWAEVMIDGQIVDRRVASGRSLPLRPGPHTVVLNHPDFEPFRQVVSIASGRTVDLTVDLKDEAVRRKH